MSVAPVPVPLYGMNEYMKGKQIIEKIKVKKLNESLIDKTK